MLKIVLPRRKQTLPAQMRVRRVTLGPSLTALTRAKKMSLPN